MLPSPRPVEEIFMKELTRNEIRELVAKFEAEKVPVEILLAQAEAGDVKAMMALARHYAHWDVRQPEQEAFWYQKAVDTGKDAYAFCQLGRCYARGRGVKGSLQKAIDLFREGSRLGSGDCDYLLYWIYRPAQNTAAKLDLVFGKNFSYDCEIGENYSLALHYLNQAIRRGHSDARYFLGRHYERGEGVAQNRAKALALYRRAAEEGCAFAQRKLERMPNLRLCVKPDAPLAT
jgi:TPR repeat protein